MANIQPETSNDDIARLLNEHCTLIDDANRLTARKLLALYRSLLANHRLHNHRIKVYGDMGVCGLEIVKTKGKSPFKAVFYAEGISDNMGDRFPLPRLIGEIERSMEYDIVQFCDGEFLSEAA